MQKCWCHNSYQMCYRKFLDCTSEPKWCWDVLHDPALTRKTIQTQFNGLVHDLFAVFICHLNEEYATFDVPPRKKKVYSLHPQKTNWTHQKWRFAIHCFFKGMAFIDVQLTSMFFWVCVGPERHQLERIEISYFQVPDHWSVPAFPVTSWYRVFFGMAQLSQENVQKYGHIIWALWREHVRKWINQ